MKTRWEVLNLGAGVGSTTVYLMAHFGDIPPLDAAVFADTGEEPQPVYEHLRWLLGINTPPIVQGSIGRLGDHLLAGTVGAGQGRKSPLPSGKPGRFTSIPAWTAPHHEDRGGPVDLRGVGGRVILTPTGPVKLKDVGRTKRQCTKEYKIEEVSRLIRRLLLGLKQRQRIPKGVVIRQHFGLSDDEGGRIIAVKNRFRNLANQEPVFPLARLGMTRADCVDYLEKHVPHVVPRSACTFCPYRDAEGWLWLKQNDPAGFERACQIDDAIRDPTSACTRGMRQSLYIHPSLMPLRMADVEGDAQRQRKRRGLDVQRDLFGGESACMAGVCGV